MFNNIILLGYRYTGKTTLAKYIAKTNNFKYIDLDEEIEKESKQKIFDLLQTEEGWNKFRKLEFDIFKKYCNEKNAVISCGAGFGINNGICQKTKKTYAILEKELLKTLNNSLKIVLFTNKNLLINRIKEDYKIRPLLHTKKSTNLDEIIKENLILYKKRAKLYKKLPIDLEFKITSNKLPIFIKNNLN